MRVVSLVPSVTETLVAWGVVPVACTRFCEQPQLPTVGGTKNPAVAAIVDLRPDLVVVDEEENRREDAKALVAAGVQVHVTAVRSVDDVAATLDGLAGVVGVAHDSKRAQPAAMSGTNVTLHGRAFVPIWRRPWMTISADTYGSSLVQRLGIGNVFADSAERYPVVALDVVLQRSPDVVLVPTEPYAFGEEHLAELEAGTGAPATMVDGKDLFWWGVRTEGAIARLGSVRKLLQPGTR